MCQLNNQSDQNGGRGETVVQGNREASYQGRIAKSKLTELITMLLVDQFYCEAELQEDINTQLNQMCNNTQELLNVFLQLA